VTESHDEARTHIIRRAPTAPLPPIANPDASDVARRPPAWEGTAPPSRGGLRESLAGSVNRDAAEPAPKTVVAACAVTIISGWATSVVATDLIAGWWRTDRLFCVAVGFLAVVFAAATVTGVIMLLERRPLGRYLIIAGAVIALLTYGGVFIAGARVAWIVYTLPVLPIASAVLVLRSDTKRWLGVD
jgi:hypothetical protein